MTWVFDHSPYKLGARLVHLAIADSANDEYDHLIWASQGGIAEKAGVSRATVNSTLARMVADGWLDEVDGDDLDLAQVLRRDPRAKIYRFRTTCRESDISRPVKTTSATCQNDSARPVKTTEPDLLLTQIEPKENLKCDYEPLFGFQHFWDTYPKRNGKRLERGVCEGKWKKLTLTERRAAWRGAVNYAKACEAGLTMAKDPKRWLAGRHWTDWQEAAEAKGGRTRNSAQQQLDNRAALHSIIREDQDRERLGSAPTPGLRSGGLAQLPAARP